MVKQDLPTPPPPTTTSLYSRINYNEGVRLASGERAMGSEATNPQANAAANVNAAAAAQRVQGQGRGRGIGGRGANAASDEGAPGWIAPL